MRSAGLRASLAALALATGAAADELTVTLESDTALRVHSPRRLQKSQNRLTLSGEIALPGGLRAHGDGWLLYDPVARLTDDSPDFSQEPIDRWQIGGGRRVEVELRELYLDWDRQFQRSLLRLRVGKQQVVWGQSFGLRVLDIVNAQDFREFLLDDFNDARTPTFGVRADLTFGALELQAIAFPDFEPDVLPDLESEFAFEPSAPGLLPALAPFLAGTQALALVDDGSPHEPRDWTARSTGFGFRGATAARGIDLAFHYWDRPDARPFFSRRVEPLDLGGGSSGLVNHLERRHRRVRTLGFAFSAPLADFVLWGEGGFTLGRGYVSRRLGDADGFVLKNDLQYALGLDWTGGDPLFANLQLIQLTVLDHDGRVAVEPWRTYLSALLRAELLGATLIPQLFAIYGADRDEWLVRPSLEWKATDRVSLTLGADLFAGPRSGLFGQYAHGRRCYPVPAPLPAPEPSGCHWEPQPGSPSRVFLRVRFSFSTN
jgi:hypothetical protein